MKTIAAITLAAALATLSLAGDKPKTVEIDPGAVIAISEQTLDLLQKYAESHANAIDTMYEKHELFKMPDKVGQ